MDILLTLVSLEPAQIKFVLKTVINVVPQQLVKYVIQAFLLTKMGFVNLALVIAQFVRIQIHVTYACLLSSLRTEAVLALEYQTA